MDHFISMYIDNELSLDEKIRFLKHVQADRTFTREAIALLEQEKLLSATLNKKAPAGEIKTSHWRFPSAWMRQLGWAVAACLLVIMTFMVRNDLTPMQTGQQDTTPLTIRHRFVLQHPGSRSIEITGSFTNWLRIPLVPVGTGGYWEVEMDLPPGEHRYSFIIDGHEALPDPTVQGRETDDFGSTNSILKIEV